MPAETSPEETQPAIYWGEPDPDGVASDRDWLARCRQRLVQAMRQALAGEVRARTPTRSPGWTSAESIS